MGRRIVIIQGNPDPRPVHFGHALAQAYRQAAEAARHDVRTIDVAGLEFPLLRTSEDYRNSPVPDALREAQASIGWAEHIVLIYPLWMGSMPALLKGFLEQVLRPGFATSMVADGSRWEKLLTGRSARIVITMGMPAFFYRWYFRAHSLKSLERNILRFCGIGPVRETLIGSVETLGDAGRAQWLEKLRALGEKAV